MSPNLKVPTDEDDDDDDGNQSYNLRAASTLFHNFITVIIDISKFPHSFYPACPTISVSGAPTWTFYQMQLESAYCWNDDKDGRSSMKLMFLFANTNN